jgi:hypothetical protein
MFATGRHILQQIDLVRNHQPRGYEQQSGQLESVSRLCSSIPAIKLLVFQSQYILTQMYGLSNISSVWHRKLDSCLTFCGTKRGLRETAEAVDMLLDWREATRLFLRMRQRDWRALRKLESLDKMGISMPKVFFNFGNPIGLGLKSNVIRE